MTAPAERGSVEPSVVAYAEGFLAGYTRTVDEGYAEVKRSLLNESLLNPFFPLYERVLGRNVAVGALYTTQDFYLLFLEVADRSVEIIKEGTDADGFTREWTFNVPVGRRFAKVVAALGITGRILRPAPSLDGVNIPGTRFVSPGPAGDIANVGFQHGVQFAHQAGERAEKDLPDVLRVLNQAEVKAQFEARYQQLSTSSTNPQKRGQEFEGLWREILDFYGWKPRKMRIPGEENDFTAIHQGLHILGEVRWFAKPMDGGKLREFLGKLDPRPQTIGLFVSHSGLDDGAWSVIRRAVNSKTVVVFQKDEIEAVIRDRIDPADVFNSKLRDAYDYIFEVESAQTGLAGLSDRAEGES